MLRSGVDWAAGWSRLCSRPSHEAKWTGDTGCVGIEIGWIDHQVAAEFPELRLRYAVIDAGISPSPAELVNQLKDMSTRFRGPQAMKLPTEPIPVAYRAFFRQVGVDPDVDRTPVEAVIFDRIMRGRFLSRNRLADALTSAIVETQVALSAFDADRLSPPLGIRPDADGALGIQDADRCVSPLFGPPPADVEPTARTRRVTITAVGVAGVKRWQLDHALWRVADLLGFDLEST